MHTHSTNTYAKSLNFKERRVFNNSVSNNNEMFTFPACLILLRKAYTSVKKSQTHLTQETRLA